MSIQAAMICRNDHTVPISTRHGQTSATEAFPPNRRQTAKKVGEHRQNTEIAGNLSCMHIFKRIHLCFDAGCRLWRLMLQFPQFPQVLTGELGTTRITSRQV